MGAASRDEVGATQGWEAPHRYGPRVHLLNHPYLLSLIARIGDPATKGPETGDHLRVAYATLVAEVASREFPVEVVDAPTRMLAKTPHGRYRGKALARETPVVIACVIRAGMLPSQTCFEMLARVIDPDRIRIDTLAMARITDNSGRVTGVSLDGSKIGGSVEGSILLCPDPMGATGCSPVSRAAW